MNFDKVYYILAVFGGALIIVNTLTGVIDVVGRSFFNQPLQGQVEITSVVLVYIVFLGYAYSERKNAHIRIMFFGNKLSERGKLIYESFITLLAFVFFSIVTYSTWIYFWRSWEARETMLASIRIPAWYAKFAVPLGLVFIVILFGTRLLSLVKKIARR